MFNETLIPLREKKFAKTKIAIMNAFVERLNTIRFEDISIRDICESVEVSEATFFNYFPKKIDILKYFKQLGTTRIYWHLKLNEDDLTGLEKIYAAFDAIADIIRNSDFFLELVSTFTKEKIYPELIDISDAEKFYAFPDMPQLADKPCMMLDQLFKDLWEETIQQKQISPKMVQENFVIALISLMIGVPLAIRKENFKDLKKYYHEQIDVLLGSYRQAGKNKKRK